MTEGRPPGDEGPDSRGGGLAGEERRADRGVGRTAGWREVLLVAAIVVGAVFAIQVGTSLLPTAVQEVVFRTPLAIIVLVIGTIGLLIRVARRPLR